MAEEIDFKNPHFWNFKSRVTLTLTSDDLESHIIVNVSSTLTLCLIVDVRTYVRTYRCMDEHTYGRTDIFTGFIRSSRRRWPKTRLAPVWSTVNMVQCTFYWWNGLNDVSCVKGWVWKAGSWDQGTESWPRFSWLHATVGCNRCIEASGMQLQSTCASVYTQLCKLCNTHSTVCTWPVLELQELRYWLGLVLYTILVTSTKLPYSSKSPVSTEMCDHFQYTVLVSNQPLRPSQRPTLRFPTRRNFKVSGPLADSEDCKNKLIF